MDSIYPPKQHNRQIKIYYTINDPYTATPPQCLRYLMLFQIISIYNLSKQDVVTFNTFCNQLTYFTRVNCYDLVQHIQNKVCIDVAYIQALI